VRNLVGVAYSLEISLPNFTKIKESECEFKDDKPFFVGWLKEAFVERYCLTAEMNAA
jgi:hypothetical protein